MNDNDAMRNCGEALRFCRTRNGEETTHQLQDHIVRSLLSNSADGADMLERLINDSMVLGTMAALRYSLGDTPAQVVELLIENGVPGDLAKEWGKSNGCEA